jgi:hypothetical protein
LIRLINIPVNDTEQNIHRLPGHRVRRFYIERQGQSGRVHFMDGTPTDVVFHLGQDEPEVLHWIGLPYLRDGDRQWFDLAACAVEKPNGLGRWESLPEGKDEKVLATQWV